MQETTVTPSPKRARHVKVEHVSHVYKSQLADGSWVHEVRHPVNADGKRPFETVGTLAQAKARARRVHDDSTPHVMTVGMTLSDVVASWRGSRDIEETTAERYDGILELHVLPKLGKLKVRDIDRNRIMAWLLKLERHRGSGPLGSGTKKLYLAVLKVVLAHAVEIGAIGAVPKLDRKRTPKAGESRKRVLSPDEETLVLAYCGQDPWLREIITVALNQAFRQGEVAAIQWPDLDFANDKLTVRHTLKRDGTLGPPKGKKVCVIDVMPKSRAALLAIAGEEIPTEGFVFVDEQGQPRRLCDIASAFKRACTLADLKVTDYGKVVFHSLRHTGISRLANHPAIPLVHVRDFARHSDLAVTQGYVHRIESEKVKSAMAEALA